MEDKDYYVLYIKGKISDIMKISAKTFIECVSKIPDSHSKTWINISDTKGVTYTPSDFENVCNEIF